MRRISCVSGCEVELNNEQKTLTLRSKSDMNATLADAIADVIITDCKSYYINEKIKLPIRDRLCASAFTSVLSTFDRDTDKIIAKTLVKLTPQINIDSLYEFGLYILKNRWDEVVHLANENIRYLVCQKTFMELLRFLISNVDERSREAHIIKVGDKFEVLGTGFEPIDNLYINESLPDDIQIVNKLVAIAPKQIFLHMSNSALQNSIKNIFGTCTVVN